jgi:hypothetical protein
METRLCRLPCKNVNNLIHALGYAALLAKNNNFWIISANFFP